jgi:hypothetical protein
MEEDDFDYEAHERLRDRVANEVDSVLWTYKAYYEGADWYAKWDRIFDWSVFGIAALLTIGLIWEETPQIILISLAIITAVVSGYRRMANPGETAENYYRAANAYQRLFDDFRDFIKLELADEEVGLEQMEERYKELARSRRNLNEDMPDFDSKWYEKLDEDSIYEEVETDQESKERLTGEAKLIDDELDRDLTDSQKDKLTGSTKLEKDKET